MTEDEFKIKIMPIAKQAYPMALRMLSNSHSARDAIQQGLLKIWEKRNTLTFDENTKALVFRIVRNICLDEYKRKKPIWTDKLEQISTQVIDFERQYDAQEAVLFIEKIIEQLPETQREVIKLRDIDGLEFEEIAEILSIEPTYVRVLLSRARKQVRDTFEKLNVTRTKQNHHEK